MTEFDDRILINSPRRGSASRFSPAAWFLVPLAAILFQVYVPRFIPPLSYLELPLLVTVYLALMRRQPTTGAIAGALIGLAQDALSSHPLGMFGIQKTLVGYFAGSVSQRFDVENISLRFMLSFFLVLFAQFFYWVMARALLGQSLEFQVPETIIQAFLNAVIAIPLFRILDRLRTDTR